MLASLEWHIVVPIHDPYIKISGVRLSARIGLLANCSSQHTLCASVATKARPNTRQTVAETLTFFCICTRD